MSHGSRFGDTASRDGDRVVRSWLHEDRHEDATRVLDTVLTEVDTTPQRSSGGTAWRFSLMNNNIVRVGLAAAAVVVIAIIAINLLPGTAPPGGEPSVSPSVEPSDAASSAAEPSPSGDVALPEGPVAVWNPLAADPPIEDAPSITMTISTPGWTYSPEFQALFKGEDVDNMTDATVIPGSSTPGTAFYVYGDPCEWQSTTPETPADTVDEIVAALAAQADRDASEPVDVTVDGYAGKMITLHVPDDADFADCDGGEFASYGTEAGPWQWHQGPGQIDDFWFVDVEGSLVEIRASWRPGTPAELIEETRSIVESSTFEFP
jgi:hypothetical protein